MERTGILRIFIRRSLSILIIMVLNGSAIQTIIGQAVYGKIHATVNSSIYTPYYNTNSYKKEGLKGRVNSPKLGRWLTVDPLTSSYPGNSPYSYALNSPIQNLDVGGEWVEKIVKKYYEDKNGNLVEKKTFWDIFKKTVRKEVHLRIHNAKLYNVNATHNAFGGGDSREYTQEELNRIAGAIQSQIETSWGTKDNPLRAEYNGKKIITSVEFVEPIEVINNLNDVKNGKNPDDLYLLFDNIQDFFGSFQIEANVDGLVINSNTFAVQASSTMDATSLKLTAKTATHEFTHRRTGIPNEDPEHDQGAFFMREATPKQMWWFDTGGNSSSKNRGSNWNRIIKIDRQKQKNQPTNRNPTR